MQRLTAFFALSILAATACGAGIAVCPLDTGEWLSGGLAVWIARTLDAEGPPALLDSEDIRPGDLAAMSRAAAAAGFGKILVVNCGYLGERVTVELFLFDTGDEALLGFWQGLVNYDALQRELPSGLRAVVGHLDLPAAEDPLRFLDDRRADFTAAFGG